jgi:hypothetical protein
MKIAIAALVLIPFAWVNGEVADSVGQYQLDAAYICTFTGAVCRGRHPNRIVISQPGEL